MNHKKIHIAVVGLGPYGLGFARVYLKHPNVSAVSICDNNPDLLRDASQELGIGNSYESLEEVLVSPEIDAVHIATPVPLHTQQSLQVLDSGKHCACAVPMATTLSDIRAVVDAQRASGKTYMMMETAVYTDEFFYLRDMLERGELGELQYLRGAYHHDVSGSPPMLYATHAVAPPLALAGCRATKVFCLASGSREPSGSPYPVATALLRLEERNLAVEIERSSSSAAIGHRESFDAFGDKAGFEWVIRRMGPHIVYKIGPPGTERGRPIRWEHVDIPDRADLLPAEMLPYSDSSEHEHLVHEFVSSIVEERRPYVDAVVSANWTAPGICAHQSAINGGVEVEIPEFE